MSPSLVNAIKSRKATMV